MLRLSPKSCDLTNLLVSNGIGNIIAGMRRTIGSFGKHPKICLYSWCFLSSPPAPQKSSQKSPQMGGSYWPMHPLKNIIALTGEKVG